jgi:hypothetical protein
MKKRRNRREKDQEGGQRRIKKIFSYFSFLFWGVDYTVFGIDGNLLQPQNRKEFG